MGKGEDGTPSPLLKPPFSDQTRASLGLICADPLAPCRSRRWRLKNPPLARLLAVAAGWVFGGLRPTLADGISCPIFRIPVFVRGQAPRQPSEGAERGLTDGQPPHALPIPQPATAGGLATGGRRGVSVSQSSPKVPAPQSAPCPLAGDEGAD